MSGPANTNPPEKQTARVSRPAELPPTTTPASGPEPDDSEGGGEIDTGDTPPSEAPLRPPTLPPRTTRARQHTVGLWGRIKLLLDRNLEKIIKILIRLCVVAIIVAVAAAGKLGWDMYHEDKSTSVTMVDRQIKEERDKLRVQIALQEIEKARLTNEVAMLQKGLDQLADNIASNRVVAVTQQPRSNTPPSQPTNQAAVQTEPPKNIGSGLVTVNENHGDIKIIIKSGDNEKSAGTLNGPDSAEDLIPNLAEATGNERDVHTDVILPSGGNGIRYYYPNGWSAKYRWFNCSKKDFKVYRNRGSREVPDWHEVDASSSGPTESLWFQNVSDQSIKFAFTLTAIKK